VARLAIIGPRAVDRLIDAYEHSSDRGAQVTILRALEAIGDPRSEPVARRAIETAGDVGVAAAGVLRALLTSPTESAAAAALDTLIALALDATKEHRLRLAAVEALQEMPGDVRTRVVAAVRDDLPGGLHEVALMSDRDAARAAAIWTDAVEGRLPDEPRVLRDALSTRASTAPLGVLQKMIDAVRAKEQGADAGWLLVRGALHQSLALRGSPVALYDLRESLDQGPHPLPVSFLAALHVLGDESCLEPIVKAWTHASGDERGRQQLASTFRAIARRKRITSRHAVMKRIAARLPQVSTLWQTTDRRSTGARTSRTS
jgi:hypothetical protein